MSSSSPLQQSECALPRKPGTKRLCIVAAVAVYVLLGVPVWWHTTTIPRPPLPHALMQQADTSLANTTLLLPVAVHVYLVDPVEAVDGAWMAHTVHQQLAGLKPPGSSDITQVSIVIEQQGACHQSNMTPISPPSTSNDPSQHPPTAHVKALPCLQIAAVLAAVEASQRARDEDGLADTEHHHQLDESLQAALTAVNASIPGQYVLFVLPGVPGRPASVVVGQHRHAWLWTGHLPATSTDGAAQGGLQQLGLPVLVRMLFPQPGAAAVEAAKKLPMSAAGQTLLLFTLANGHSLPPADSPAHTNGATARDGTGLSADGCSTTPAHFTWRFADFHAAYIQPLSEALAPLLDFHAQSQVRLHTTSHVNPKWSAKQQAFLLRPKQLPYFIDSDWNLEFGLDASVGSSPAANRHNGPGMGAGLPNQHAASPGTCSAEEQNNQTCLWPPASSTSTATAAGPGAAPSGRYQAVQGEQYIPAHVLHMVLYVPPAAQRPLRIAALGGGLQPTNSFWMRSWGAVHILPVAAPPCGATAGNAAVPDDAGAENAAGADASHVMVAPDSQPGGSAQHGAGARGAEESQAAGGGQHVQADAASGFGSSMTGTASDSARGLQVLSQDDMHGFAESVVSGIRVLLGLSPGPHLPAPEAQAGSTSAAAVAAAVTADADPLGPHVSVLAAQSGVASWEVDLLVRSRTAADIASAARVLGSFSRLAQKLPNLAMPGLIGSYVSHALQELQQAAAATAAGQYAVARAAAQAAHGYAEGAFSHPAILAQLSFPNSHKVGVYVPFFFPALLPVALALVSELRRQAARRKAYRQALSRAPSTASTGQQGLSLEEQDRLVMMQALQERQAGQPAAR